MRLSNNFTAILVALILSFTAITVATILRPGRYVPLPNGGSMDTETGRLWFGGM